MGGNHQCEPRAQIDTSHGAQVFVLADRADDWRDKASFHPVEV